MAKLTKPSDGYFLAKRQMVAALDVQIAKIEKEQEECQKGVMRGNYPQLEASKSALFKIRDYVRNYMLWDTSEGP